MIANGLITWVPALLMRGYGATVRDVALYYRPVVGISLAIGLFFQRATISWFAKRSLRAYTLIPAAAMLLCAPLFAAALSAGSWQMSLVLINFVVPPALTLVQNLAAANVRSTAGHPDVGAQSRRDRPWAACGWYCQRQPDPKHGNRRPALCDDHHNGAACSPDLGVTADRDTLYCARS